MKKLLILVLALCLFAAPLALAEQEEAFFPEDMTEYVSDALGCSVLFPAVFSNYVVDSEDPARPGIHAQLPDETAELTITRQENVGNLVNETWIALQLQEYPDAGSYINEVSGTSRITRKDGNMTHFTCCLFSNGWQYSVELSWTDEHDEEFSRLINNVTYSFSVYELGIG